MQKELCTYTSSQCNPAPSQRCGILIVSFFVFIFWGWQLTSPHPFVIFKASQTYEMPHWLLRLLNGKYM